MTISRVTRRSRGLSDVLADPGGAPVAVAGAPPGQLAAESTDPAAPRRTVRDVAPGISGTLAFQDVDRAALRPDESRRAPGRGKKRRLLRDFKSVRGGYARRDPRHCAILRSATAGPGR